MRGFLAARAIAGVERVEPFLYVRSFAEDGAHGVVRMAPSGDSGVGVEITGVSPTDAITTRIRRVFDLDADIGAIGRHLSQDPILAPLIHRRPGLRPPGAWDGFELAMRAVLGQQITVAAARLLAGRLAALCGSVIAMDDLTHVFPTPAQVLAADLSQLGMPGSRRATIKAVAAAAYESPELFAPCPDLDTAIARLTAIKGVGAWTAHYIALRALRHPDAFPASDVGLLRTMERLDGTPRTPLALLARAEAWRPYRAYAAQHLWSADHGAPNRD